MRAIYTGLKDPAGKEFAPPFPKGHEGGSSGWRGWITGNEPPLPQTDGTLAFGAKAPSGYTLMDANFRFLALDDDAPGFSWRTFRFPADLPRLQTMTQILSPLDPDLRPLRQGRRPADRLSRLGRPGHQRARHAALRRGSDHGWPAVRRPPTRSCAPTSCRACTTAAAARASIASTCSPQLEQWVERGVAPTPGRGLARRRRRRRPLASAVPAPAGGGLQRIGLDRRRGQLRLPRRHLERLSFVRGRSFSSAWRRLKELPYATHPRMPVGQVSGATQSKPLSPAVNGARSAARAGRSRCGPSSASSELDRDRGRR